MFSSKNSTNLSLVSQESIMLKYNIYLGVILPSLYNVQPTHLELDIAHTKVNFSNT